MTDRTKRTEAFAKLGWGVFTHYIGFKPTTGNTRSGFKPQETWNDRVNMMDTDKYAQTLHEVGAHYAFFVIMQGYKYMCAPNATFDRICGTKPGEACSERDLIADLIKSLKKYDIPLFLYFTGDGPYRDEVCGPKMGYYKREEELVTYNFVKNWADVLQEYAERYGKDVHGWWIDGTYAYLGYNEDLLKLYRDAVLAGNPDAIVAFNKGGYSQRFYNDPRFLKYTEKYAHPMMKGNALYEAAANGDKEVMEVAYKYFTLNDSRYSEHEDFTSGEVAYFDEYPPEGGMVDGSRWHVLGFLGQFEAANFSWRGVGWNALGSRYSGKEMHDYVKACNAKGGVVSIDCYLFDDGSFDKGQMEVLRQIEKGNY